MHGGSHTRSRSRTRTCILQGVSRLTSEDAADDSARS
jgi:hypothetical protein